MSWIVKQEWIRVLILRLKSELSVEVKKRATDEER
jgi:hypothetical protein